MSKKSATPAAYGDDWGKAPEGPSEETDGNSEELVLQSWAFCKAKKNPLHAFRTDVDEKKRRDALLWRKRASFLQLDCGEDSFFVSNTYKVVGIADGVGGWKDKGVDPSKMSNKLMENCKLYSETHRQVLDARKVLAEAYTKVLTNKEVTAGSTTACVVCLREGKSASEGILDIANIGDSGALLIRNRSFLERVHEKVHGFNAPYQLAVVPKQFQGSSFDDKPSDALREQWECREGDVLVLATDGYFDNIFQTKTCEDAGWVGQVDTDPYANIPLVGGLLRSFLGANTITYSDPYRVVQRLVVDAYKISNDEKAPTPWGQMMKGLGYSKDDLGGKPDDITVLLARVVRRGELKRSAMW